MECMIAGVIILWLAISNHLGSQSWAAKIQQGSGAMQGQRGTFGFHEQGESTRLKIYFYVTAI